MTSRLQEFSYFRVYACLVWMLPSGYECLISNLCLHVSPSLSACPSISLSALMSLRGPVFQHYDGPRAQGSIRGPPQPQQPASREDDRTLGANLPDELTLKHMAQDYSSLKNQLLKLQTILQVGPACSEVDVYMSHIYI